jgi:hypothetical protein
MKRGRGQHTPPFLVFKGSFVLCSYTSTYVPVDTPEYKTACFTTYLSLISKPHLQINHSRYRSFRFEILYHKFYFQRVKHLLGSRFTVVVDTRIECLALPAGFESCVPLAQVVSPIESIEAGSKKARAPRSSSCTCTAKRGGRATTTTTTTTNDENPPKLH